MALILEQQPQTYSPAYNQQPYVLRETDMTDADIANWRVVVSVFRDGVFITGLMAQYKLRYRYGTGGRIVFDPMRCVEEDLSFDHQPQPNTVTPWSKCENSIMQYGVLFVSQYFDGTQWVAKSSTTGTELKFVYNAVFDPLEFVNYDDAENFATIKALTNAPTSQNIGSNDSLWLHSLTDVPTAPDTMKVTTYDWTGGVLATVYYSNPFSDWSGAIIVGGSVIQSAINKRRRVRVAVGPRDLAAQSTPISFVGVGSYIIQFQDSGGAVIGQTWLFTLTDCSKFTPTRLHWLNRLGGFDAYTFKLKSTHVRNYDRDTFGKQHNVLAGGAYGYTTASRGTKAYNIEADKKLTIHSDILSDAEVVWFDELIGSPTVYMENSDGTMTSVHITNKQWALNRGAQDGVTFAEINLEYSLTDLRQRG